MNIALAQLNYIIGDFDHNFTKIKEAISTAKKQGANLVVFGELAVCGYPPRDFLEFSDFIQKCRVSIAKIAALTTDIAVIVGAPAVNPVVEGKDLFNAAYFLHDGKVAHVSHKALLPTYDIFDEYRYFEPASEFSVFEFMGKKIALTVCEDIWNIGNENPLYETCPMDRLIVQEPDVMINISASPFDYKHAEDRIDIVRKNVARYGIPMFYVNNVGAHTEVVFDGGSIVMNQHGTVFDEMPYFEAAVKTYKLSDLFLKRRMPDQVQPKEKNDLIHRALIAGIRDYFGKLGFKKAILGLSGGIDSAITLALAAEALGPENVLSVLMPSKYSSDHSVNDSVKMCENLGSPHKIIAIEKPFNSFLDILTPHFEDIPFNVTEENLQARSRAVILMALSNKLGYILLNTSNKSEAAVGYGTLYGDMCGGISVIGDVYKTEVYELSRFINRNGEIIPDNIITKPPSAELRPDQFDSDSLPDYDILDAILFQYIELRKGPKQIIAAGFDEKLVARVLRLVNMSEYKRYQTPPMLRVSPKAFGMGRRMPIVGKYLA